MIRKTDNLEELCETITQRMCCYLNIDRPILTSLTIEDRVCEIMASKITRIIGIRCQYNYKNPLINFFSSILGDVVLDKLGFNFTVAHKFKYIKYNGINFEHEVAKIFDLGLTVDEAIAQSIHFLEENKFYVAELNQVFKMKMLSLVYG